MAPKCHAYNSLGAPIPSYFSAWTLRAWLFQALQYGGRRSRQAIIGMVCGAQCDEHFGTETVEEASIHGVIRRRHLLPAEGVVIAGIF